MPGTQGLSVGIAVRSPLIFASLAESIEEAGHISVDLRSEAHPDFSNPVDILVIDTAISESWQQDLIERLIRITNPPAVVIISSQDESQDLRRELEATGTTILDEFTKPIPHRAIGRIFASDQLPDRRISEADIRKAIDNSEFELAFQPKFSAANDKMISAECLLRWPHPDLGLISPAIFIPLAEERGLVGEITSLVICKATEAFVNIRSHNIDIDLAINISMQDLLSDELFTTVNQCLEHHGIEAHSLILELTETSDVSRSDEIDSRIEELKKCGLRISLDDFGIGYSSFSRLYSLEFDEIKIDKFFVDDFEHDPKSQKLVRALIALAHELEMKVVVEGIESASQGGALKKAGCDVLQGYFYSKPLSLGDFLELSSD